jgi:hypothetical protein
MAILPLFPKPVNGFTVSSFAPFFTGVFFISPSPCSLICRFGVNCKDGAHRVPNAGQPRLRANPFAVCSLAVLSRRHPKSCPCCCAEKFTRCWFFQRDPKLSVKKKTAAGLQHGSRFLIPWFAAQNKKRRADQESITASSMA